MRALAHKRALGADSERANAEAKVRAPRTFRLGTRLQERA